MASFLIWTTFGKWKVFHFESSQFSNITLDHITTKLFLFWLKIETNMLYDGLMCFQFFHGKWKSKDHDWITSSNFVNYGTNLYRERERALPISMTQSGKLKFQSDFIIDLLVMQHNFKHVNLINKRQRTRRGKKKWLNTTHTLTPSNLNFNP